MFEVFPTQLTTTNYEAFVTASRYEVPQEADWQEAYSQKLSGELMEFLIQHGNGSVLLMLKNLVSLEPVEGYDELRFHMGDEMGDLLWFTTDKE